MFEPTGQVTSAVGTAEYYDVSGNWREIYQNRQLNALVAQTSEGNIDLRQTAIGVNRVLYQANTLGVDLVPSFSGLLSASTPKNLRTDNHGNTFSSQPGLSYELGSQRRLSVTAGAQTWEYQATRQDMADIRPTLTNNVADAHFNIAYLNEVIELAQKPLR